MQWTNVCYNSYNQLCNLQEEFRMPKTEITYEIVQQIGILKENKSGWQRELNIVK